MDFNKYLGVPFRPHGRSWDGCDCWGMVRLIYKEELNIDLPSYNTKYDELDPRLLSLVVNECKDNIMYKEMQIDEITMLDILLFYQFGQLSHVGLYVGNNQFIHTNNKIDTAIELLTYHNKRNLEGIYRVYTNNSAI